MHTLAPGKPDALRESYFGGDGLCLPHLRLALGLTEYRDAVGDLTRHFPSRLEGLATDLVTFLEASTPSGATLAQLPRWKLG